MLQVTNLSRLMIGPVSFTINDGECVAITGPSGTGKSVLVALAGRVSLVCPAPSSAPRAQGGFYANYQRDGGHGRGLVARYDDGSNPVRRRPDQSSKIPTAGDVSDRRHHRAGRVIGHIRADLVSDG